MDKPDDQNYVWEFLKGLEDPKDRAGVLNAKLTWERLLPDLIGDSDQRDLFLNTLFADGKIEQRRQMMNGKCWMNNVEVQNLRDLAAQIEINKERELTLQQRTITEAILGQLIADIIKRPKEKGGNTVLNALASSFKDSYSRPTRDCMRDGDQWLLFCNYVCDFRRLPTPEETRDIFKAPANQTEQIDGEWKGSRISKDTARDLRARLGLSKLPKD